MVATFKFQIVRIIQEGVSGGVNNGGKESSIITMETEALRTYSTGFVLQNTLSRSCILPWRRLLSISPQPIICMFSCYMNCTMTQDHYTHIQHTSTATCRYVRSQWGNDGALCPVLNFILWFVQCEKNKDSNKNKQLLSHCFQCSYNRTNKNERIGTVMEK